MSSAMDPLKISLDEYIANCNQTDQEMFNTRSELSFKSGRRKNDCEEEEDDILDTDSHSTFADILYADKNYADDSDYVSFEVNDGIEQEYDAENDNLKDNLSKTDYDLRLKLVSKSNVQRGLAQNMETSEYFGMPKLVPLNQQDVKQHKQLNINSNFKNNNHKRRNRNLKGYWNHKYNKNLHKPNNSNGQQNSYCKNRLGTNSTYNINDEYDGLNAPLNLYIQTNALQYKRMPSMKNLKITFDRETPQVKSASNMPYPPEFSCNSNIATKNNLTQAAIETLDAVGDGQRITQKSNGNDIQSLLGISGNVQTNNISELAGKFLDFLQNGTQQIVHKPIYDMKIQKQIHDLQRKQFRYCKPGGEIVTGDGPGINNCRIKPNASGISLNCRFI